MNSRLSSTYPEIANQISFVSVHDKRQAALSVARWALSQVGYSQLLPIDFASAEALVDKLDSDYFDLQDRDETEAALTTFQTARAMHSLLFALQDELSDAVYEAIAATDDPVGAALACGTGA